MDSATFREWLAERGCHFDQFEHGERGHGHAVVTVHREGRKAALPLGGAHLALDEEMVRQICQDLDLDWRELPGPRSRV